MTDPKKDKTPIEKIGAASERQAVASEQQAVASKGQAVSSKRQADSSEETDASFKEVAVLFRQIKNLLVALLVVVFISLAVIGLTGIVANRSATNAQHASEQNNRFLENFSNYMRCLIVNEEDVVIAVGEEAYLNLCDELLFRGTGERPDPIKVTIPPNFPTTTAPASP